MRELIIKVDDPGERAWDGSSKVFEIKELVRCKDCKRRGTYNCPVYVGGDGMCSEPDDWFCADGEGRSVKWE